MFFDALLNCIFQKSLCCKMYRPAFIYNKFILIYFFKHLINKSYEFVIKKQD